MEAKLVSIILENFKSYKERIEIPLDKPFAAVIGPNGAGKSNFMDAMCFVMGEKSQNLRCKKLGDLIHKGSSPSDKTSVSVKFNLGNGKEIMFQRCLKGSISVYKVNDQILSHEDYLKELHKLGINVKDKNFFISQGDIEDVALRNPKEVTAILEEISGIKQLKQTYLELKQEIKEMAEKINNILRLKKTLLSQQSNLKKQYEDKILFNKTKEKLDSKLIELQLLKLHFNEFQKVSLLEKQQKATEELKSATIHQEKAIAKLKETKKQLSLREKKLEMIEIQVQEIDHKISKQTPRLIEIKENIDFSKGKLKDAKKTFQLAQLAKQKQQEEIKKLEADLDEAKKALLFFDTAEAESSQGRDLELESQQLRKFHDLKKQSETKVFRMDEQLRLMSLELKSEEDKLDFLENSIKSCKNNENVLKNKITDAEKRIDKLNTARENSEKALEDEKEKGERLKKKIQLYKKETETIEKKVKDLSESIDISGSNESEMNNQKQREEALAKLKRTFSGVVGRLQDLVEVLDESFKVPVIKVFGKYFNAIIVDTEITAINCMKFLREQRLTRETFLPLDRINGPPFDEKLRNLTNIEGVLSVIDVLKFDPRYLEIVKFVTKNSVICEKAEEAPSLAFGQSHRYNVVTLDGVYYQKSGLISGGNFDLTKKAHMWTSKEMTEKKEELRNLRERFKEITKDIPKDYELVLSSEKLTELEHRIRLINIDLKETNDMKLKNEKQIEDIEAEMDKIQNQIKETSRKIKQVKDKIKQIKEERNGIEDKIFEEFCRELGITNIRVYEQTNVLYHQQRLEQKQKLVEEVDKIVTLLEYTKNGDTQTNLDRWQHVVEDEGGKIVNFQRLLTAQQEQIDQLKKSKEGMLQEKSNLNEEIKQFVQDIKTMKKESEELKKDLSNKDSQVNLLTVEISGMDMKKHDVLLECKTKGIKIPVLNGDSLEYLEETDSTFSSNSEKQSVYEKSVSIQLDFSFLPIELRLLKTPLKFGKAVEKIIQEISEMERTLTGIRKPNGRVEDQLNEVKEKLIRASTEFKSLRKDNHQLTRRSDSLKYDISQKFSSCFETISSNIDGIYKMLTGSEASQACLTSDNADEPYLGGIQFNCIAPNKGFQVMNNLSGGEKTLAALAWIFAVHKYQKAPFFILDEVDVALDIKNVKKVGEFFKTMSENIQIVFISHSDTLLNFSDYLIGIARNPDQNDSFIVTCPLDNYD